MSSPVSLDPGEARPPDTGGSKASRRRLPGARVLSDGAVLYWWREVLYVIIVDIVYETIRNLNEGGTRSAYDNAVRVMDWQQAAFINHEAAIQQWALQFRPFIIASNYFYGSAYILVTIFVLVYMYRRFTDAYPLARNALVATTLLGLVGFRFFPLMPPRLLDVEGYTTHVYGFVDTLATYPTFWSFNDSAMKAVSNQYAAMPSLHCAWALWGMIVLWPHLRSAWSKALAVAYPAVTVTVVVVTANHYFLDAVGGAIVVGLGYGLARLVTRAGRRLPSANLSASS